MSSKYKIFTLIEVIVALAVLLLGLTGLMTMFASSSQRAARAMQKWETSHALTQGCEYFMLRPGEDSLPDDFKPDNRSWRLTSEQTDPELPEGTETTIGNFTFTARVVKLLDSSNGDQFGSRHIELIVSSQESGE